MEGSPSDHFKASKDDQHKYINQLLALVRRFSEREESSEDERLRWSKARFAAAIVARATGHMDTATFEAEQGYHAAWFAWAVGGVLCTPESCQADTPDCPESGQETPRPMLPGETTLNPTPEQVRKAQEYARQRLLEPPIGATKTKKALH